MAITLTWLLILISLGTDVSWTFSHTSQERSHMGERAHLCSTFQPQVVCLCLLFLYYLRDHSVVASSWLLTPTNSCCLSPGGRWLSSATGSSVFLISKSVSHLGTRVSGVPPNYASFPNWYGLNLEFSPPTRPRLIFWMLVSQLVALFWEEAVEISGGGAN